METINGTTYTSHKIKVNNQSFNVLIAKGKSNYISISKDMPNRRRGSLGKEFATFDQAAQYYRSADMKVELLKIETGLI